jgi:hypothetical protein
MWFPSPLRRLTSRWSLPRTSRGRQRETPRKGPSRPLQLEALEGRLCLSTLPTSTALAPPDDATLARVSAAYGQVPLSFEANQGQADARVDFLARGSGYGLFLTPTEAVLSLQPPAATDADQAPAGDVLSLRLLGANRHAQAEGLDQLAGTSNYLVGTDPGQWHTDIANYGQVAYDGVWRGIDVVYYGNQRHLEYDFVLEPGADPGSIKLQFQGARGLELDGQGNLVLQTAGGDVVQQAPVLYQEIGGVRHAVSGHYVLKGQGQVGFEVGAYDPTRPLVIDPVLSYSTYLGKGDYGFGIVVDGSGSAYVTGYTSSTQFPTRNPLQSRLASIRNWDAFVTKLSPDGRSLVYSTYLGGNDYDKGTAIAVDASGNAYVTGSTNSTNFPTTAGAFQRAWGGGYDSNGTARHDAFVAKLNPTGNALVYSTYLGGAGNENNYYSPSSGGIAVDASGNAYVTGATSSSNFPLQNALQATFGGVSDAFVTKLNAAGTALVYSTYLGGSGEERGGLWDRRGHFRQRLRDGVYQLGQFPHHRQCRAADFRRLLHRRLRDEAEPRWVSPGLLHLPRRERR